MYKVTNLSVYVVAEFFVRLEVVFKVCFFILPGEQVAKQVLY